MADAPAPPIEPKPWDKGVAPAYIALFLGVVYYDQIAPRPLSLAGVGPTLLGVAAAGLLCFGLLYWAPARWGFAARRGATGIAEATFGRRGAAWVPGVPLAIGQVVLFAVTLYYAADLTFRALIAFGLLDPKAADPWMVGGRALAGPRFLATAFAWSVTSAIIGTLAMRLVAAVMAGYQVFPAVALGALFVWAIPQAGAFRPTGLDPATHRAAAEPDRLAFALAVQFACGFFAIPALAAAEWGASSRSERDVRLGGMIGVALGAIVPAVLAVLIVAGAAGRAAMPTEPAADPPRDTVDLLRERLGVRPRRNPSADPPRAVLARATRPDGPLPVRAVLSQEVGGPLGGAGLLTLALGLLGPACFAPYALGRGLAVLAPRRPAWLWSLLGAFATWPLIVLRVPERLDVVFGALGALVAPAIGAIAADCLRHRGAWPGPRRGFNGPGFAAWLIGLVVGFGPALGRVLHLGPWTQAQPSILNAYVVAFLVYFLLATLGAESPPAADRAAAEGDSIPAPAPVSGSEPEPAPAPPAEPTVEGGSPGPTPP